MAAQFPQMDSLSHTPNVSAGLGIDHPIIPGAIRLSTSYRTEPVIMLEGALSKE